MALDQLSQQWDRRRRQAVSGAVSVSHPIAVFRAEGSTIWDVDGGEFIDFAGGVGCMNVGHSHPRVLAAIEEQASRFVHTDFTVCPYPGYITLAERLAARAPVRGQEIKAAFFSTGAEAVENAVKLAKLHTGRHGVIAFERGFHGRTQMALTMTWKEQPYKAGLGPFVADVHHCVFPRAGQGESFADFERSLMGVDLQQIACVVVEPVQGEGGFNVPAAGFLPQLRELCDRHGIVLVADEVQSGYGRTGKFFAVEHFAVEPDLICVAKSIAAGLPLSGVIGRRELLDARVGAIGGTFIGNPLGCAAALAVLDVFESEGILEQAAFLGEQLEERFDGWQRRWAKQIIDSRGLGAMRAIELADGDLAHAVQAEAFELGLILLTAGVDSSVLRCLCPLTISPSALNAGLAIWESALERVLGQSD